MSCRSAAPLPRGLPLLLLLQGALPVASQFSNSPPPPSPRAPPLDCTYTPNPSNPDLYYDLTLAEKALSNDLVFSGDSGGKFYTRICRPPKYDGGSCTSSDCPGCTVSEASALNIFPDTGQGSCAAIGTYSTAMWQLQDPTNDQGGAQLVFTAGDGGRSSTIKFMCDWSVNSPRAGSATEPVPLNYQLEITTSGACVLVPPGLSWGWLTLILLLVALVVYCVGGSVYNYKYRGEEGVRIIPQFEHWAKLPGLVSDGCKFSWKHGYRFLKNAPREFREWYEGRNNKELKEPIAYTAAAE